MFSRLRNTIDNIATKFNTANTYTKRAIDIAQKAAHYTKRGLYGNVLMVADGFAAANAAYDEAIRANSITGKVKGAAKGFSESFMAGYHIGALSGVISEAASAANGIRLGKSGALRTFGTSVGYLGIFLIAGHIYLTLREQAEADETVTEDETDFPTVDDTDIIDAEAHWEQQSETIDLADPTDD